MEGLFAEFQEASAEGMRLCLAVARDLQAGGESELMEAVSKELTGIVCLEREAGCMQSALQLVETSAQTIEREGVSEDPQDLLVEMEGRLRELLKEDFDPCTHSRMQELAQLLEGDGEHEMEGDVLVERVQVSVKCPLTGCYLEDPVSNSVCGHTYSRAAVEEHINRRTGREARCPVCSGPVSLGSLRAEPELADRVRRAKRKEGLPQATDSITL